MRLDAALVKIAPSLLAADLAIGWAKGRRCEECIFSIREVLRWCEHSTQPVALLSLGLHKCFDKVSWSAIQRMLIDCDDDPPLRAALLQEVAGTDMRVRTSAGLTASIDRTRGGTQGRPELPVLARMVVNHALAPVRRRWADEKLGLDLVPLPFAQSLRWDAIIWADNIWLFAPSLAQAERMARSLPKVVLMASAWRKSRHRWVQGSSQDPPC